VAKTSAKRKTSLVGEGTLQNNSSLTGGSQIRKTIKTPVPPGMGLVKDSSDAADYIVEMLVVLCNIAKDVDLKFLNYLLEMAYEESLNHTSKKRGTVKSQSR